MYKLIIGYADSRYGTLASFVTSNMDWATREVGRYTALGYVARIVNHPSR